MQGLPHVVVVTPPPTPAPAAAAPPATVTALEELPLYTRNRRSNCSETASATEETIATTFTEAAAVPAVSTSAAAAEAQTEGVGVLCPDV